MPEMSLEQKIRRYEELKDMIATLEAEKKAISTDFRTGLDAFGVGELKVPVGEQTYQLKITTRTSHSCQWEALKNVHPDIYSQFVSDRESSYVDIRQVRTPATARPGAVLTDPNNEPVVEENAA